MSGVDTRPVPCNLMAWPRVRDLISQHKLIYAYLYFGPDTTACGCYLVSVERMAADLSMTAVSLEDALDEFDRRGLVQRDKETGEIHIVDWPRWHNFATPAARGALWSSIAKIQSRQLWIRVENAYKSISKPGKGKGKDKASSKEEGRASCPPGWWKTNVGTQQAAEALCIESRPGEEWDALKQRIWAGMKSRI